jgi:hypothetical protein
MTVHPHSAWTPSRIPDQVVVTTAARLQIGSLGPSVAVCAAYSAGLVALVYLGSG